MDDVVLRNKPRVEFKTIGQIVEELENLSNELGDGGDNSELKRQFEAAVEKTREVLLKNGYRTNSSQFFNSKELQIIIGDLEKLGRETEIENILKDSEEFVKPESSLDKMTLDELVADYEKAQESRQTQIQKEIYKRTGKENVKQFIESQRKIAEQTPKTTPNEAEEYKKATGEEKAEIKENLYNKSGVEDTEQYVQKIEEVLKDNSSDFEKLSPKLRNEIAEELAVNRIIEEEETAKIVEKIVFEREVSSEKIEKSLKSVKDSNKIERLARKVEEIRAEIKVKSKAEEIAQKTLSNFKEREIPVEERSMVELEENILRAWKEGDRLKIPHSFGEKSNDIAVIEAIKATDKFKEENIVTVVNYRANELGREIGFELRKNGVKDESLIREYIDTTNQLNNNPETARIETNRSETADFIESKRKDFGAGQIERSIDEARFMAKNVVMAPKKFNKIISRYNKIRNKIGADKLPKIKEIRVTEKMTSLFKNSPQMVKMMNGAQRMVGFINKVNAIPGNFLTRIGVEKVGMNVLGRIGGQASVEFVKNASLVIAEQGTFQGIRSIATALFTKGAVTTAAGGGAAAGSGALAGAVAAFQAIPVVGQIVLVVVAGIMILKPVVGAGKKLLGKVFHVNPEGVKNFISDSLGLGKIAGSVGQFVFDIGALLIGIPTVLAAINFTAIIAPVVIFFFLGTFLYSMLQQNLVSSIVPPAATGGGNCVLKSTADNEGMINCDQNAPANDYPGINKANFVRVANTWHEGKNYSEECYNDTVNRALCAGINPAYALWAWVHESGASNYSINEVEDFGIHGQASAPPKNYSAQISYFLKLNPGQACPNLDYWLSFATNYLTGGCDPDAVVARGQTGRTYLKEMQETWSWISSEPMPSGIKISAGGQNCGSVNNGSEDEPIVREYTDEKGQVWICYGGQGNNEGEIPDFEPWDPNVPVPEGCPSGRPTNGYFTQGPFAISCSHENMSVPAVDFGAGDGTAIVATHPGVAVQNYDSIYGYYIDVHGKCDGVDFYTRYAHMPANGFRVENNSQVSAGQQIGVVDNTGSSTGSHLHYHISGLDKNKFGQYLGLTLSETQQLWGCCGSWNGKACP